MLFDGGMFLLRVSYKIIAASNKINSARSISFIITMGDKSRHILKPWSIKLFQIHIYHFSQNSLKYEIYLKTKRLERTEECQEKLFRLWKCFCKQKRCIGFSLSVIALEDDWHSWHSWPSLNVGGFTFRNLPKKCIFPINVGSMEGLVK